MSARRLCVIFLALLHLPFHDAQYLFRAQAPYPTIAPLFIRQETTCDASATSCTDGRPGCCDVGAFCTVNSNKVPICLESCDGGPTCSGIMSGGCCKTGYTCDYQSTLCKSNSLDVAPPTFTEANIPTPSFPTPSANVAPQQPASSTAAAAPNTGAPNTGLSTPKSSSSIPINLVLEPTTITAPAPSSVSSTTAQATTTATVGTAAGVPPSTVTTTAISGQGKFVPGLRNWLVGSGLAYVLSMVG